MPSSRKQKSSMSSSNSGKLYAVKIGRNVGVYKTWAECEAQVKGHKGAKYQSFKSESEARQFARVSDDHNSSSGSNSGGNGYGYGYGNASIGGYGYKQATPTPSPPRYSSTPPYQPSPAAYSNPTALSSSSSSSLRPGQPINVYCDGASAGNGRQGSKAGYGIYFEHPSLQHLNQSTRLSGPIQTNNRAELTGILSTLTSIPSSITSKSNHPIVIHSDSQYSINSIQDWSRNWRRNGWKNSKGEVVSNKDLIRSIGLELEKLNHGGNGNGGVRFIHVKGHNGDYGNEMADKLATDGAKLPEVRDEKLLDLEPPDSDSEEYRELVRRR